MQVLFTGVWNWLILCLLLSSIIQTGAILTGRRKTLRSTPKPDLSYNVSTSNENHIFVDEIEEQILGWAKWSQWSACSKTCGGGGIQFQLRRCLDVRCSGPSKRHRLCEIQECPYGSRTDVEIECSLRDTVFSGNNLPERWIPLLHKNQCTLVCQSELTGQNRNFNTSLKDGTVCKREDVEKAACLQGKCERVGCDMIIGSSAQFDQCGVCGGNGESCGRNVFRWKDTQQFSPCDKTCGPD
uniref:ADAMTS/ADAMTS-like cysteine-rich domain-containing protein n=1 Tax=Acrobeloides nanus TaxID=290746 RepID=A0A914CBC2_9BILA